MIQARAPCAISNYYRVSRLIINWHWNFRPHVRGRGLPKLLATGATVQLLNVLLILT